MNKHFYFAYGMNTNLSGMKDRCPAAVSLGSAELEGYKFRFAGPADIVKRAGYSTYGVLWELTDECLASLDRLEGYPTYYTRFVVPVEFAGTTVHAWVYQMTPGHNYGYPSSGYWQCLVEGYREHGISTLQLLLAREYAEAWEDCEDHYEVGPHIAYAHNDNTYDNYSSYDHYTSLVAEVQENRPLHKNNTAPWK